MLKIEIECLPSELDDYLKALSFMRRPFTGAEAPPRVVGKSPELAAPYSGVVDYTSQAGKIEPTVETPPPNALGDDMAALERPEDLKTGAETPDVNLDHAAPAGFKRKPGEPSPGKRRRTAVEVAEDEALAKGGAPAQPAATPLAEPIDPAVIAADEADEAAESAASKTGLTRDDVRTAFGAYIQKFGIPTAQANIRDILGSPIAEIPETQEALAEAIEKIKAAMGAKKTAPEDVLPPDAPGTKADVLEAILDYGRKYDGSTDTDSIPLTREDIPKVLKQTFGPKCANVGAIPVDQYGKAVAAIRAALAANTFKREAKS